MIPSISALMNLPQCPIHKEQMILSSASSVEQRFCGVWYRCPHCGYTVLLPSKELKNMLGR